MIFGSKTKNKLNIYILFIVTIYYSKVWEYAIWHNPQDVQCGTLVPIFIRIQGCNKCFKQNQILFPDKQKTKITLIGDKKKYVYTYFIILYYFCMTDHRCIWNVINKYVKF